MLALFVCLTAFDSFRGRFSLPAVDVRAISYLCCQFGHFLFKLKRFVWLIYVLLRAMVIISNDSSSPVDILHFAKLA